VSHAALPPDPASPLFLAGTGYALVQGALALYGLHRWFLLAQFLRLPRPARTPAAPAPVPAATREGEALLPRVTVQLPVHDERWVIERLVDAACALDYPRDRLEVQVLDDSTDETTALARACVARARARGIDATVLHRESRQGFKAGALAAGLARARGELIAVFDADFVPPPDFLRRLVGEFADPRVGLVQARWGHLNRDWSALTEAQALFLDGHFTVEHAARAGHGRFFNFNGTAGVWRRACIEEAGGWTHDTLTEDLDLSYRAQMAGWRFVYRPDVVAPAELPVDLRAFKGQQRRWAKGSLQTARKILPALWASRRPLAIKLEALAHLTSNLTYLLLLASIVLLGPVLLIPDTMPRWLSLGVLSLLFLTGMGAVSAFFLLARRAMGESLGAALARLPGGLLVGVGMSWTVSCAVVEGLLPRLGTWERTPKDGVRGRGDRRPRRGYRSGPGDRGTAEALLAGYAVGLVALALERGRWGALPFLAFVVGGFALVAWWSWSGGRREREAPGPSSGHEWRREGIRLVRFAPGEALTKSGQRPGRRRASEGLTTPGGRNRKRPAV
jgi:cellulose synthase/poly-beta-1,6-N-acetylglucosamine synthase-like glycosyltransferase